MSEQSAEIVQTLSAQSSKKLHTASAKFDFRDVAKHFPLSWSHYVKLLAVKKEDARKFYEAESLRGGWSVRQLERQINSLFYERALLSKNKAAMLKKGEKALPEDALAPDEEIREPFVLEFLNLKDEYSELDLEEAIGSDEKVLKFQTKSGLLTIEKENDLLVLDFPSRPAEKCETPEGLIEAIGKQPKEVLKSRDYLMIYENEREILDINPNFAGLLEIDTHAVIVTAKGESSDFVSRFFAPAVGVTEDPVTGSAHCTLIPYWAEKLGKEKLYARQISARGGALFCELKGERVKIGGNATLYLKGEIYI